MVRAERQRGAVFEEFRDGLLEWLGHLLIARECLECERPVRCGLWSRHADLHELDVDAAGAAGRG